MEEELLVLDLCESPVKRLAPGRLKKKRTRAEIQLEKNQKFLNNFEFMRSDKEDEIYIEVSDDDEEEFVQKVPKTQGSVLAAHGLMTPVAQFKLAFDQFCHTNDFRSWIETPSVKRRLDKVWAMLRSFNQGSESAKLKEFWIGQWQGNIKVRYTNFARLNSKCIACILNRDLNYKVIQTNILTGEEKVLGYMGPHCYKFKFKFLNIFNKKLRELKTLSFYPDFDLEEAWGDEMDPLLEEMIDGIRKMKAHYS